MQPITSERFITQMKLRELRRQRDKLLAAYAEIEQRLTTTADRSQEIKILYDGLRDLTFAHNQLHPTVRQLDVLIHKLTVAQSSDDLLTFWLARLRQELATGQRRTNIMYLFGALLEEWFAAAQGTAPATPEEVAHHQAALAYLLEPAPNGDYLPLINLFAGDQPLIPTQTPISYAELNSRDYTMTYREDGEELISFAHGQPSLLRDQILLPALRDLYQRIDEHELQQALEAVRIDRYRATDLRTQATRILADEVLLREMADALTIQVQHLDDWTWPEAGIPTSLRWQRTRYRLYLDEDLPTS